MGEPPLDDSVASVNEDLVHRVGGKNLVGWHHSHGRNIDAAEYLERYRRALLCGLSRTRLLYLDTNYWVRLRKAELGCGTLDAVRLLQTLRAMVRSREILCVSHFHSFLEIGKQEEASLRVTARLLDELTEARACRRSVRGSSPARKSAGGPGLPVASGRVSARANGARCKPRFAPSA